MSSFGGNGRERVSPSQAERIAVAEAEYRAAERGSLYTAARLAELMPEIGEEVRAKLRVEQQAVEVERCARRVEHLRQVHAISTQLGGIAAEKASGELAVAERTLDAARGEMSSRERALLEVQDRIAAKDQELRRRFGVEE